MKNKVQVVVIANQPGKNTPKVLLLKTTKERGSFWQNVTGSVKKDEKLYDAALRELIEETGIDKKTAKSHIYDLDTEFFFSDRKNRHVKERVYYYYGPPFDVELSKEHSNFRWLSVKDIEGDRYKYPSNYHAIVKSLDQIKKEKS